MVLVSTPTLNDDFNRVDIQIKPLCFLVVSNPKPKAGRGHKWDEAWTFDGLSLTHGDIKPCVFYEAGERRNRWRFLDEAQESDILTSDGGGHDEV